MKRYPLRWIDLAIAVMLMGIYGHSAEPPPKYAQVRASYVQDFLRQLSPVQQTYLRELEELQLALTKSGSIAAAETVRKEKLQTRVWRGFPVIPGQITFQEAKLAELRAQYEQAVERLLKPIQTRYLGELLALKNAYSKVGELDSALLVQQEIESTEKRENLPTKEAECAYLRGLDRDGFSKWLQERHFQFPGIAGTVTLRFKEKTVGWEVASRNLEYDFLFTSRRRLTIKGNEDYKVEFDDELQRGSLTSSLGTYEFKIMELVDHESGI